jgi:hypothetical protein
MPWFYLSFASATDFIGACVVEAADERDAVTVSHVRRINPGGEVMILRSPDGTPGPHPTYKLLTREELGEGATLGELRDRGMIPPEDALIIPEDGEAPG